MANIIEEMFIAPWKSLTGQYSPEEKEAIRQDGEKINQAVKEHTDSNGVYNPLQAPYEAVGGGTLDLIFYGIVALVVVMILKD